MKFNKKKIEHPAGYPELTFTEIVEGDNKPFPPFQIVCTPMAMHFEGTSAPVESMQDLQNLAQVISTAWKEHQVMASAKKNSIVKP